MICVVVEGCVFFFCSVLMYFCLVSWCLLLLIVNGFVLGNFLKYLFA